LEADEVITIVSLNELRKKMEEVLRNADVAYIIAPESDGVLRDLINLANEVGATSLNCQVEAVEKVSDKSLVYERLREVGVTVPTTLRVGVCDEAKEIEKIATDLGFPLVFKPTCGIGCSGLSLVKAKEHIRPAIEKIKRNGADSFLIQEFLEGSAASVSLICNGNEVLPLTLNQQVVNVATPDSDSQYYGGMVPFHHPLEEEALDAAKRAVEAFEGLRGYVGIDLVLTDDGPFVVEINPRLTTSYVGLRKVIDLNLAQVIMDSVIRSKLPKKVEISGYACFFKVKIPAPSVMELRAFYRWENMISPPFPLKREGAWSLIVASASYD